MSAFSEATDHFIVSVASELTVAVISISSPFSTVAVIGLTLILDIDVAVVTFTSHIALSLPQVAVICISSVVFATAVTFALLPSPIDVTVALLVSLEFQDISPSIPSKVAAIVSSPGVLSIICNAKLVLSRLTPDFILTFPASSIWYTPFPVIHTIYLFVLFVTVTFPVP